MSKFGMAAGLEGRTSRRRRSRGREIFQQKNTRDQVHTSGTSEKYKLSLAYITGVALGDGNLSNSNGRAVRLRISCDAKYPNLIKRIAEHVQFIFPMNKVSFVIFPRRNCVEVSCYSNKWEGLLGWKAKGGPKDFQKVSIPTWIKMRKSYSMKCLKGLIETDGSVYMDRKYKMVNYVTVIENLATEVEEIISKLGFLSHTQKFIENNKIKHTIRISKNVQKFLRVVKINKS